MCVGAGGSGACSSFCAHFQLKNFSHFEGGTVQRMALAGRGATRAPEHTTKTAPGSR